MKNKTRFCLWFAFFTFIFSAQTGWAKTAEELDALAGVALNRFEEEVYGAADVMSRSKAVLVFPTVFKAGIGLGGQYGEGVLRINDQSDSYYNIIAGSFGFQLGAQARTILLFFMEENALDRFKVSSGWRLGVDASVALIKVGAEASIDTMKTDEPIVAFVMDQKGLMYNLNIEGAKINKITK